MNDIKIKYVSALDLAEWLIESKNDKLTEFLTNITEHFNNGNEVILIESAY